MDGQGRYPKTWGAGVLAFRTYLRFMHKPRVAALRDASEPLDPENWTLKILEEMLKSSAN